MDSSASAPPSAAETSSSSTTTFPKLTITQREQLSVESKVAEIFQVLNGVPPHTQSLMLELWRDNHMDFLTRGLIYLGPGYQVLDANRPWVCYWILHSIALLEESVDPEIEDKVVDFLSRCQDKNGGYGGGPGQLPHLATTYATVNALVSLGSERAFSLINRDKIYMFLLRMKDSSGGYRMHDAGEIDVRACYTAISVASILNVLDNELANNVGDYILSCQTYEGGIAGEPGSEAHGGYTFCGLATMILIDEAERLDLPSLIDWVAFRQGVECGFQGRTNKLVDGCYSFWQGGVLALLQRTMSIVDQQLKTVYAREGKHAAEGICGIGSNLSRGNPRWDGNSCETDQTSRPKIQGHLSNIGMSFFNKQSECDPLFHNIALQQYILLCSQVLEGGFKDKPGKYRDFYHTCYCLSGLSVCQYSLSKEMNDPPLPNAVLGPYSNLLEPVHPLFNVVLDRYLMAHEFFSRS